jgi:hypothetical protein
VNFVLTSPPLKMAGKAWAFVYNGELGKMSVPKTDYDSDDDGENDEDKDETDTNDTTANINEEERWQDSDVVVAKSLLAATTVTLKRVLEMIDPAILSASELRHTLLSKLEETELMDRERRLWCKDLPVEHWNWLIREMGLAAVSPATLAAAGAAVVSPLYVWGTMPEYSTETRITLYTIDKNITAADQKIVTYETKMNDELALAKLSRVRHTKLYHFKLSKLFEKKLEQAHAMLLNLQEIRASIDHAAMNVGTVAALSAASETLKNMRLDGDKVHDVLDDLQEHMDDVALDAEYFQQINPQFDEDELMKELKALPTVVEDQSAVVVVQPVVATSQETAQLPDITAAELQELKVELENLAVDETTPTGTAELAAN